MLWPWIKKGLNIVMSENIYLLFSYVPIMLVRYKIANHVADNMLLVNTVTIQMTHLLFRTLGNVLQSLLKSYYGSYNRLL